MHLKYLTFDTDEPMRIARFWGDFLDGEVEETPMGARVVHDRGPRLLFLPVPESKTAKNRCHPDFHTPNLEEWVERAVVCGATETGRFSETHSFVVFQDPDGNEFCIVEDDEPDPYG